MLQEIEKPAAFHTTSAGSFTAQYPEIVLKPCPPCRYPVGIEGYLHKDTPQAITLLNIGEHNFGRRLISTFLVLADSAFKFQFAVQLVFLVHLARGKSMIHMAHSNRHLARWALVQ
jgi:hypothetical protein